MAPKIQIVFYSMYGHIHKMAEAVAAGARSLVAHPLDGERLAARERPSDSFPRRTAATECLTRSGPAILRRRDDRSADYRPGAG